MCTVNGLCHYHTITTFGVLGRSWPAAWGKVGVLGRSFFSLLFCRVKGGAKLAGLGRSSKSRPGWGVFGGVRGRSWPAWGELWKRPLAGQHFSVNWQNIDSVTESVKMQYSVGKRFFFVGNFTRIRGMNLLLSTYAIYFNFIGSYHLPFLWIQSLNRDQKDKQPTLNHLSNTRTQKWLRPIRSGGSSRGTCTCRKVI